MPSVCKILPLKCSPRWSCEQLSSWETRNYIWLQSALRWFNPFSFFLWVLSSASLDKEMLSMLIQICNSKGSYRRSSYPVSVRRWRTEASSNSMAWWVHHPAKYEQGLLTGHSWADVKDAKGCGKWAQSTGSYASVPGKGHFRSGLKSLGRTVWGILLGICPQDSHLQSVLIFGSFRVASSTHKKDVKKVRTGIFPCYIHPSTIKFQVCTSKQLPNQENHTTRIYFSFWDQLIPYALQCLFLLLILAWQDARGFRVQLTALSWQDGYTEPFAGTWKKEWETLSTLELFKITLRVLLADSSAPAGSNCIMLEQKARHSTAGGRGV